MAEPRAALGMPRAALGAALVACLVLAALVSPLGRRLRAATPPPAPGRPAVAAVPAVDEPAPAPPLPKDELTAWRTGRAEPQRDPFFTAAEERALAARSVARITAPPAAVREAPPPPLPPRTVTMILIAGASRVATIDGRLLGEGEMIGDERVVEIRSNEVVLERGGRRRTVAVSAPALPVVEAHGR